MEKETSKMPEEFCRAWEEVRQCASMLRDGKARIVTIQRTDGSQYRYTQRK